MAKATLMRGSNQSVAFDVSEVFTDPENGRNLDGGTAYLTVKPASAVNTDDVNDTAAVIKKDVEIVTHPENGIITFNLVPEDTVNVTPGKYVWGAQTKEADGTITEFIFNPEDVTLIGDITRRTN